MLYNGLKDDLDSFAKFVYIYANEIEYLKREKDFSSKYPTAYNVFKSKLQKNMKFTTCNEIANLKEGKKQTLFFTGSKAKAIEFCRHIRNSFSHGLLENKADSLIISDKDKGRYTSKGYLDFDSVKMFIEGIVNDYENDK
jgi:hypothetical protein